MQQQNTHPVPEKQEEGGMGWRMPDAGAHCRESAVAFFYSEAEEHPCLTG
jgi:hypothetical protein